MSWARAAAAELFGLFVDDGLLAVAVLGWLALCWLVLPAAGWAPLVLFAGLAAILVLSAARHRAGKR